MKKIILILSICLSLLSCEQYVTEISDVTLMGLYVVREVEVVSTDPQYSTYTSYHGGQIFQDNDLPEPFNYIRTNDFNISFENTGFVGDFGIIWTNKNNPQEIPIWAYDTRISSNEYFKVIGNNAYDLGYLKLHYRSLQGNPITMIFKIEKDGYESLQLLSSGTFPFGQNGEKKQLRLYLTRIHP